MAANPNNDELPHTISEFRLSAVQIQLRSQQPNDVRMAFKQVNQWLQNDPENHEIYKMLANVANEYPELSGNIQNLLETMCQKGSKSATDTKDLLPVTTQDLLNRADEAYYRGDVETAIRIYRHTLKQEPDNQRAKSQLAKLELSRIPGKPNKDIPPEAITWYRRARSYIAGKDYYTAVTFLNAAVDAAREKNIDFRYAKDLLRVVQSLICPDDYQEEHENTPSDDYQSSVQDIAEYPKKGDKSASKHVSILFLSADPTNADRIRIDEEVRAIQDQFQLSKHRSRFKVNVRLSARPPDISQALLDFQPQIVHFSGHGTNTGALCFENKTGLVQPVAPDALAALFAQFSKEVNCVILNACYAEIQARAIAEHIEWVIGMNNEISDEAAISFSIGFYQAMGAGRTIEDAYKLGCVQIRLQGIPEHLTPVLIKKE